MGELTKGRYTYGDPIRRGTGNTVTIRQFCSIATSVIMDGGFSHNSHFISTFPFHQFPQLSSLPSNIVIKGDIIVGNDVWIGEGAVIMSGVTIGDGAVIGMRAIVSKDVPPYAVVVGAPQKILRYRFYDHEIQALLNIKWWDWSVEKIIQNAHLLQADNIDKFLNIHAK